MDFGETIIPGCRLISISSHEDERGNFRKIFRSSVFSRSRLDLNINEVFCSTSLAGVVRGMHLQVPPFHGGKLIYCVDGGVLDVVLDLRKGSHTYGVAESFRLTSAQPAALFIPPGVAHGFLAIGSTATLVYCVSAEHAPEADTGVRWDSFGFDWPIRCPVISARDSRLPTLEAFDSPFVFDPEARLS